MLRRWWVTGKNPVTGSIQISLPRFYDAEHSYAGRAFLCRQRNRAWGLGRGNFCGDLSITLNRKRAGPEKHRYARA